MLRTLLICGLIAGLCGGIVAAGVATVAGEPAIDQAIAVEDGKAKAAHEEPAPELVPRDVQKSFGLLTATCIYGIAIGGMFAIAFAYAYGRVGRASPRTTGLCLAAIAFVVLYLVPFLKYPATPPAIGDPDTIEKRTLLYVVMICISVLAAVSAARLRTLLVDRLSGFWATVVAVAAYVVVVIAAGVALPGIHEVPADFPATTLWRFREGSIALQAALWATLGLVFSVLAQRVMTGQPILPRRSSSRREVAAPARD
jgi:predicted cobalt transporter CbtA